MRKFLATFVLALAAFGCNSAGWRPGMDSTTAALPAPPAPAEQTTPGTLLIFGGMDHKTFLGCLTCSQYASDSVFNTYGQHGSRYATESIWNQYSEFGSRYSSYGACNSYASDPVSEDDAGLGLECVHSFRGEIIRRIALDLKFTLEKTGCWRHVIHEPEIGVLIRRDALRNARPIRYEVAMRGFKLGYPVEPVTQPGTVPTTTP